VILRDLRVNSEPALFSSKLPARPIFLALLSRSGDGSTTLLSASFLAAARPRPRPRPRSPRLCAAVARARTLRRPGRPLCWTASGGYLARLGLGGPLLPSLHASRLRARSILSRSLPLRPCDVPARFLVLREGPPPSPFRTPVNHPQVRGPSNPRPFEIWIPARGKHILLCLNSWDAFFNLSIHLVVDFIANGYLLFKSFGVHPCRGDQKHANLIIFCCRGFIRFAPCVNSVYTSAICWKHGRMNLLVIAVIW
jgi:hypothetical protein